MIPVVVAFDLSLTATGVADDKGTSTIKPKTVGVERLAEIRKAVLGLAHGYQDLRVQRERIIAIEGYSMGTARQASRAHALGELGGVIRLALWEAKLPYLEVPPASIKRYACGKGNANKAEVYGAAIRRLGYAGSSNDEADAAWLRALVLDAMGHPIVEVPKAHRDALDVVRKLLGAVKAAA